MFTKNCKIVKFAILFAVAFVMLFVVSSCGESEEQPKVTATVQVSVEPTDNQTATPTGEATPTAPIEVTPTPTGSTPEVDVDDPVITTKYVVRRDFADHVSEVFAGDDLEEAKLFANMNAHTGYSVFDASGNIIYCKYSQNLTKLFNTCKMVSDILVVDGFKIGVAPKNPAIDNSAKLIDADSYVGWVLYECGYAEGQSADKALTLTGSGSDGNLMEFCEAKGFTKITNFDDIKAGDIVFYSNVEGGADVPNCVCIVASDLFEDDSYYLYDYSTVENLGDMQPMRQPLLDLMFAYRIN